MRLEIPFIGPSYQARSVGASAQRAVNCYLEIGRDGAKNVLYGTEGLKPVVPLGRGPVRGAIVAGGYAWFVSYNHVYRVAADYSFTDIGIIQTSDGPIGIEANALQILIVDGLTGYIIDLATSTLQAISDPDFPNGVTVCTFQDGFFLVAGNGTGQFFINQSPNDGLAWNGTDFASAEGSPDSVTAIISDHREVWILGGDSAEIWVNTGNSSFPFERSGNAFIEHGIAAPGTLTKLDNTVFWLSSDSRGSGLVYRASGYTPERISTHAIEEQIGRYSTIADAFAFTYQRGGHSFYVLTFPTGNQTWVYDVATNEWHERAAFDTNSGLLGRWRPSCHVFFNNKHLVGDSSLGNVYELDENTYTDNGEPIKRLRSTMSISNLQFRQFYSMLQVMMDTGVGIETGQGIDPKLILRYSDDYGNTWSNYRTSEIGKIGEYGRRAKFNRLGSGRNRVWEISMTDPVKFAVFNAVIEYENGYA